MAVTGEAVIRRGAEADAAARKHLLIATHSHAQRYLQRRNADIDDAFTALAATDLPDESCDVMEIAARLTW